MEHRGGQERREVGDTQASQTERTHGAVGLRAQKLHRHNQALPCRERLPERRDSRASGKRLASRQLRDSHFRHRQEKQGKNRRGKNRGGGEYSREEAQDGHEEDPRKEPRQPVQIGQIQPKRVRRQLQEGAYRLHAGARLSRRGDRFGHHLRYKRQTHRHKAQGRRGQEILLP